jgi:hypothetical protein
MNAANIMHTNELTAEQAIATWSHHFYQLKPDLTQPQYPDQTIIETWTGLGKAYRHVITYKIAVVQYRYTPRGQWRVGYIGYNPIKKQEMK